VLQELTSMEMGCDRTPYGYSSKKHAIKNMHPKCSLALHAAEHLRIFDLVHLPLRAVLAGSVHASIDGPS